MRRQHKVATDRTGIRISQAVQEMLNDIGKPLLSSTVSQLPKERTRGAAPFIEDR